MSSEEARSTAVWDGVTHDNDSQIHAALNAMGDAELEQVRLNGMVVSKWAAQIQRNRSLAAKLVEDRRVAYAIAGSTIATADLSGYVEANDAGVLLTAYHSR